MKTLQREQPLILVVDNEQEVLDATAAVLTGAGFACRCCRSVDAAITTAAASLPDLIISDVALPEMSGVEMCERIQRSEGLAEVPVMFLSAAQTPDIIRRRDGRGGAYYVRKPPAPQVLLELVEKSLSQRPCLVAGMEDLR